SGRPSMLTILGCGLILGGAAGNLLDRLSSGEVTDYVHFSFWYIFNAADAAIVVGVGLLLLRLLTQLAQYAPGEEDVALPLRELGEERYFVVLLLQRNFFVAVLKAVPYLRQLPDLPLFEPVVVRFILEAQREDALGDQVPAVDAGEALRDNGPDAEVQRRQRGVLAARTLPVVVPAHDKARRHLLGLPVVLGVEAAEGEFGDLGYVRAERHYLDPVRREVARRDVVLDYDADRALQRIGELGGFWWRLYVR